MPDPTKTLNMASSEPIDLLSFDSWEFSAEVTEATVLTEESSLFTVPSVEEGETNTVFFKSGNIQVSVSGVIFSLSASVFEQMDKLPWKWSGLDKVGIFYLHTSPVLFEMLLNHVTFGTLPVLADLSTADVEELEPLALLLDLHVLRKHLVKKTIKIGRSASFRRPQPKKQHNLKQRSKSADDQPNMMTTKSSKPAAIRAVQAAWTKRRFSNPHATTEAEDDSSTLSSSGLVYC